MKTRRVQKARPIAYWRERELLHKMVQEECTTVLKVMTDSFRSPETHRWVLETLMRTLVSTMNDIDPQRAEWLHEELRRMGQEAHILE